jgi:membrane protein
MIHPVRSLRCLIGRAWNLLLDTAVQWDRDEATKLAAMLAFYTVFSFAPVLILLVAGASFMFGTEAAGTEVISRLESVLSPSGARMVQSVLQNAQPASKTATIIGLLAMLFGATAVFAALQDALNRVWGVKRRPINFVKLFFKKRLISFLMLLVVGIFLLLSTTLGAFLSLAGDYLNNALPWIEILKTGDFVFSVVFAAIFFGAVYKVLPDVRIAWADILIGAFTTSVLFNLGKMLIGLYLARSTVGSLYGAAGSFAVFLIWIYYSSWVFFFGAEFMQVCARKRGVPIVPDKNAVAFRIRTDEENA